MSFLEAARRVPDLAGGLGELFQRVLRRGALGLEQRLVDRLGHADAMHLEAGDLESGMRAKARICAQ